MKTVKQPAQFYLVLYRGNQIVRWSEYFIVAKLKKGFTVLKKLIQLLLQCLLVALSQRIAVTNQFWTRNTGPNLDLFYCASNAGASVG